MFLTSRRLLQRLRCRTFATTTPTVHHLDLNGLSILERLVLEEYLYQTQTKSNWVLIGTHGLHSELSAASPWSLSTQLLSKINNNNNAAIVLGIGGKIPELLYTNHIQQDDMTVIRRFSGGGTVLMNPDCIWTTLIGRDFPVPQPPFYPRPLMEYTATQFFHPLFTRLQQYQQEQQSFNNNNSSSTTDARNLFSLREHDFVWDDGCKIAGNAQSIGKAGWLHHTSFLWQIPSGMSRYLRLPTKRPEYRASRPHEQFVQALATIFPDLTIHDFRRAFQETSQAVYHVKASRVLCASNDEDSALSLVVTPPSGGLQEWYQTKSRTKVITQF